MKTDRMIAVAFSLVLAFQLVAEVKGKLGQTPCSPKAPGDGFKSTPIKERGDASERETLEAKGKVTVVTFVSTPDQERLVKAMIKSIRERGGSYRESAIFVVTANAGELPCESLKQVGIDILPLEMDRTFLDYPLARKAFAAVQVEKKVKQDVGTLVWLDPGVLVLKPLEALDLGDGFDAAVRPVTLANTIGMAPQSPPNDYWQPIYEETRLDYARLPVLKTIADEQEIQPYYNCEAFSFNPRLGIAAEWARILTRLLRDDGYQKNVCTTFLRKLFLHQAVLSAVITSKVKPERIKPLPLTSGYPFNQHDKLPSGKAIHSLNELSAVIFDNAWATGPEWLDKIPCREPLKSWLQQTYREYLEPGDVLKLEPNEKSEKYLFYLHGKIIEDQGIPRPRSEKFGYYEYEKILATFRDRGFTVLSEIRPANTGVAAYAEKVAGQIRQMLQDGVLPSRITVVGASKGGVIAILASALLQNRGINFVFLSSCYEAAFKNLQEMGTPVAGNILSIYDDADDTGCGSYRNFFALTRGKDLGRTREIVLHLGLGHGILYRPLSEWVEPVIAWASNSAVAEK